MMRMISRLSMMRMIFTDLSRFSKMRMIFKPVSRFSLGGQDHLGDPGLPRERLDGGLGQQVDPQVEMMNYNIVCNIFILSGKTNQDCKDKDGNNPVTLGLENMRGVSTIVITINLSIIINPSSKPLGRVPRKLICIPGWTTCKFKFELRHHTFNLRLRSDKLCKFEISPLASVQRTLNKPFSSSSKELLSKVNKLQITFNSRGYWHKVPLSSREGS